MEGLTRLQSNILISCKMRIRSFGGTREKRRPDKRTHYYEISGSEAVGQERSASGRLIAFFRVYEDVVDNPPFLGGCPLQNTAVENDDTHSELYDRARQGLRNSINVSLTVS
ncbi:TetR family transcriptional regulator C-terminal domain-containing protein [Cohnella sp. REN36]|uniref:TetR family transcriptional regulator C-terminal domain-containing protein n=1 Tax=Cohnella sp. REN36 TaxID=2887347 RepID=UPI003569CF5D